MWNLAIKSKFIRKSVSWDDLFEEMWDIIDAGEAFADECEIYWSK